MSSVRLYMVGGYVRDKLLGVKSKDIDYAVVAPSYDDMKAEILRRGGTIFLEKPEYLTIRARLPDIGAADFVLCRKDGAYIDGRRPEEVQPGGLYDDLRRRDFRMNAIAMNEEGQYIDPFGGREDLKDGVIRCVGKTKDRFTEDYLRMLRAIRFAVTKDMSLSGEIMDCLRSSVYAANLRNVAVERVREEMLKCFRHNTLYTLKLLEAFPLVRWAVLDGTGLWLKPTLEQ